MPLPTNAPSRLPLTEEQLGEWQTRIAQADDISKQYHTEWERATQAYEGKPLAGEWPDVVNVNKHFATIRLKTAQLFFRTGEVQATAKLPMQNTPRIISLVEAILNERLSPNDINAKMMTRKALTHLELCGVGPTKIGYEAFTRTVEMPVLAPEVASQLAPEQAAQIPTQPTEQVVAERWFWDAFSPKRLLVPAEFEGMNFDQAAWLGMRYYLDPVVARAKFELPDDFIGTGETDDRRLSGEKASGKADTRVECTEIWYYAARFDPSESNPEVVRTFTLIDGKGLDNPVVDHRLSPYQDIKPDGTLTENSMRGFPIHPLAIHYVPDRAYPPSDAQMIFPQAVELCKFRSQMMRQRDTSVPMRYYLKSVSNPDTIEKLERGTWQGMIGLDNPNEIGEIARAQYPRENFSAQEVIERDLDQTLSISSNQRGSTNSTERTATELQLIQGNVNVRLDDERNAVIDWYTRGVTKLWSLIQRFSSDQDYINILGQDGAQQLVPWTKQDIQGRFQFALKTDSTVPVDAAGDKKQSLDVYNFLAKDPQVNRAALLQDIFAKFGLDPSRLTAQPQPKKPEPPAVAFRFSGTDLDPAMPMFPLVVAIIEQGGYQFPPDVLKAAQDQAMHKANLGLITGQPTPAPASLPAGRPGPMPNLAHGGMADKGDLLNKHQEERTGGIPGIGKPAL